LPWRGTNKDYNEERDVPIDLPQGEPNPISIPINQTMN